MGHSSSLPFTGIGGTLSVEDIILNFYCSHRFPVPLPYNVGICEVHLALLWDTRYVGEERIPPELKLHPILLRVKNFRPDLMFNE